MAYNADPYADIDFEEITEATGLAVDEQKCLKVSYCEQSSEFSWICLC